MARRRSGGLTPEDRRLWEEVAATAKPLRPRPPATPGPTPPKSPPPPARPASPPPRRPPTGPFVGAHPSLDQAQPHMDRRRFDKLRRGKVDPEARLDLHGMTSERAHAALTGFILDAHARGLRLVLVITGKGRPDEAAPGPRRHGILRHSVPHWLAAPPLGPRILQVAAAHQRHGGAGALYVHLRRARGEALHEH
jgi:DNA-nicking Smr family endonuclease